MTLTVRANEASFYDVMSQYVKYPMTSCFSSLQVNGANGERVPRFVALDSDAAKGSSHPPMFAAIMRRTKGVKVQYHAPHLHRFLLLDQWIVRVTLVVDLGFLFQNFGRWWEPRNGTLSFYECWFRGGNTSRWRGHPCKRIC